jgi:transposase InsO family protein
VEGRLSVCEAAAEHGLSRQTAAKWVRRYRDQGLAGLTDRSSRPLRSPRRTPKERIVEIERLRRQLWTGVRIAQQLALSPATVSRLLRRLKLNRIRDIEPRLPLNRYEHAAPSDMLHLDIKRLVRIQRPSRKVNSFARTCDRLGLKHRRTRPYTPRTNGKAERFIKTALNEWAYAYTFHNSADRTASLPAWTYQYNWHRPHASLNQQPPISRAGLDDNNLLTHHI